MDTHSRTRNETKLEGRREQLKHRRKKNIHFDILDGGRICTKACEHGRHEPRLGRSTSPGLAAQRRRSRHGDGGSRGLAVGASSSNPRGRCRRTEIYKEIVDLEREQHKEAQHLQKQQHDAEQKLQRTQHLQDATKDLQESSKEADRDLMDARTERFQNLMMVSSLFLSGCFTLAVEGTLPEDPGTVFGGRCALVDVYYFLLAISIGLNWVTIMCSLRITSRISDYMQKVNPDALLKCRIYSSRPTHESQQKIGHAQTTGSLAEPTVDRTQAHESLEHGTFGSSTEFTKSLKEPIIKMWNRCTAAGKLDLIDEYLFAATAFRD